MNKGHQARRKVVFVRTGDYLLPPSLHKEVEVVRRYCIHVRSFLRALSPRTNMAPAVHLSVVALSVAYIATQVAYIAI